MRGRIMPCLQDFANSDQTVPPTAGQPSLRLIFGNSCRRSLFLAVIVINGLKSRTATPPIEAMGPPPESYSERKRCSSWKGVEESACMDSRSSSGLLRKSSSMRLGENITSLNVEIIFWCPQRVR